MHSFQQIKTDDKKYFILYDLETSTIDFMGQILTAYFQLVDQDMNPIERMELDLKISISRLELPHPDAIHVNKIDVLHHQEEAIPEFTACQKLVKYIQKCLQYAGEGKVKLMGYNSSRFDLPFLRTTLIRNGFNPYFYGHLKYGDGLHLVRKIAWGNPDFPLRVKQIDGLECYSFSLENISKELGVLEGEQLHEAKFDVDLLRDVLARLQQRYELNLWTLDEVNIPDEIFQVRCPAPPQERQERFQIKDYLLLDESKNAFLFVDIKAYLSGKGRDSIVYFNKGAGFLDPLSQPIKEKALDEVIDSIHHDFQGINCSNYFTKSSCDIESDIYRLSFDEQALLERKIRGQNCNINRKSDLQQLWRRYNLRNIAEGSVTLNEEHFKQAFQQYVGGRYLQGCQTNKFGDNPIYSSSWNELVESLKTRIQNAQGPDLSLMKSLETFYRNSEIKKVMDDISN